MKLLLDTNVLMDYITARSPHHEAIKKLCIASEFSDVQLWVSVQSYLDAYYVLSGMKDKMTVKEMLLSSLEYFIPCNLYADKLEAGLRSDWSDLEDYMLAHSIKHVGAEYFLTRDKEILDGQQSIPAVTPAEFLAMLEKETGLAYDMTEFE